MKQEYCAICGYPVFDFPIVYRTGSMEIAEIPPSVDGVCGDSFCGNRKTLDSRSQRG